MKILFKRRKDLEHWHCCINCGSELIYTKRDVSNDFSRGYLKYIIKCPICKENQEVFIK